MISLQEATKKQAAEFARRTREIMRNVGKLDDKMVKQAVSYLVDARRQIAEEILLAQGFDQFHLKQILQGVENALNDMQRRYTGAIIPEIKNAWDAGAKIIDIPMQTVIGNIPPRGFVDPNLVEFMQEYSASLIGKASKQAIGQIDTILRAGLLGKKSPQDLMREISRVLKTRTQAEVELIARTEINRALNMSYEARIKDVQKNIGGLKKYWLRTRDSRTRETHVEVGKETDPADGGTPIPVEEKFNVGGYWATGPYDPSLPIKEIARCRCRTILVVDEETETDVMMSEVKLNAERT